MNIGTTIKKYRIKNNLTQERLAEYLNLSVSAISQWECGKTMPDITVLPVIAGIFDITTDELLGVDLAKKQEEINLIIAEYDRLSNLGLEKERFDYIQSAYRKYPNVPRIVEKYLWMLCYDPYCNNGLLAHEEEISRLCENILNESSEDFLRYAALSVLSSLYREKGDIEKAVEYAKRFPSFHTAEEEIENVYERGTEKWWECVRSNIYLTAENLMVKIRNCALYANLSPEKRIQLFRKAIGLLELIYEEGDYGFSHYHLCELHIWIANRYIEAEDYTRAAEYLERGLSHAKCYDALPAVTEHTSYLVQGQRFETDKVYSGFSGNLVKRELDYLSEDPFYNNVRSTSWFATIIEKYRPWVRNTKT